MAMKNPPRRTTIRGQKHLLAYITPEEAKVLKAMGGSGELHHGIPSYPDYGDAGGFSGSGGGEAATGGWGGGESVSGRMEDADARVAAAVAAQEAADQGIDAETDDPITAGPGSTEYDPDVSVFGTPEAERNWVERSLISRLQNKGLKGFVGVERDDLGRVTGYTTQANPFGALGLLTSIFDITPTVYTGFGKGADFGDGPQGDGRDTVPAEYNPVTGQQNQCPDGYIFDEDLQACRMGGDLPMDYTDRPGVGAATGDLYGRMGLLDIAPTGLGMFKQRFGAGFGSPSEFDTANMAFRRSGGVQRPYEGYTLLS